MVMKYLLSIIAAVLFSSIISGIIGKKGSVAGVLRLVCKLFVVTVMLSPVIDLDIPDLSSFTQDIRTEAETFAAEGSAAARFETAELIKHNTQEYISNKASSMGLSLDVEVLITQNIPERVVLKGAVSPYAKQQMEYWLHQTLGITAEDQEWIS